MKPKPRIEIQQDGLTFSVKVVPGSRRDEMVGWLGEAVKVKVAAPPEGGRANEAVCRLIAGLLGIPASQVTIFSGHTQPRKRVKVLTCEPELLQDRLVEYLHK